MTTAVRPVILSGGAGTRLWPLSTGSQPKQFADLLGTPLFEQTLHRLEGVEGVLDPIVTTGTDHLSLVNSSIAASGVQVFRVVAEPVGRNTAPAILAAALLVERGEVLVVLPSDHLISDPAGFRAALAGAVDFAVEGHLVTFGVTPDRPDTGLGYIEVGQDLGGAHQLARFKEKPGAEEAEALVADGAHLWNSGIFVFTAATILEEATTHSPSLVESVRSSLPGGVGALVELTAAFEDVEAISIDHAVMEHTTRGVVIPVDVGWSDVGSFKALLESSPADSDGNVVSGDVSLLNVTNSYIHSTSRRIAIAEMDGVVVVETPTSVLVVPVEQSQAVRDLVRIIDESSSAD